MAALSFDDVPMGEKATSGALSFDDVPMQQPAPKGSLHPSLQSAMNIYNAATFGFGDEIAGLGGGLVSGLAGLAGVEGEGFGKGYTETRDRVRNEIGDFRKENPNTALLGDVSGGTLLAGPVTKLAASLPIKSVIGNAAATGGALGALGGTGAAKELEDIPSEAGIGAVTGAATAGGLQGASGVVGAVASNIAQRASPTSAINTARQKIAEAFTRDNVAPGKLNVQLQRMGTDGKLADIGGANALSLLDNAANTPGATKELAQQLIRARQISAANRVTEAAQRGMSPTGARFEGTMDSLLNAQQAAKPLYERAMQIPVTVDKELENLLVRAKNVGAFADAQKIAAARGTGVSLFGKAAVPDQVDPNFGNILFNPHPTGDRVSLAQMNEVKKLLWDIENAAKNEFGKPTAVSAAITDLRKEFTSKLDHMTTNPQTGESVYAHARNVFGNPAELMSAVELGKKAFNQKAFGIREAMRDLSEPEREAFRIGAFEAFREMAGSRSGQTQLVNVYKDRNIQEKMRQLLPTDTQYRQFVVAMNKEERMRRLESVRGGSQTFARAMQEEDLGQPVAELARTARSGLSGDIAGALSSASNLWNRVKTPQATRDQIGKIMLSGNDQSFTNAMGQQVNPETKIIADLMRRIQERRGSTGATSVPVISALMGNR